MPVATLKRSYPEKYFVGMCRRRGIPNIYGYYAWLLNEGTGSGEDIIKSIDKDYCKTHSKG